MKTAIRDSKRLRATRLCVKSSTQNRPSRSPLSPRQLGLKSILVPIDFSETSKAALRYAVRLAQDYGADMSVIHVIEPEVYSMLTEFELSQSKITFVESATARLARLSRKEIPAGIDVTPWVQIGVPHQEIVSAAKILNSDLIVISTHGYADVGREVFGSTAERVVRHAHCPVLVVRDLDSAKPKYKL